MNPKPVIWLLFASWYQATALKLFKLKVYVWATVAGLGPADRTDAVRQYKNCFASVQSWASCCLRYKLVVVFPRGQTTTPPICKQSFCDTKMFRICQLCSISVVITSHKDTAACKLTRIRRHSWLQLLRHSMPSLSPFASTPMLNIPNG